MSVKHWIIPYLPTLENRGAIYDPEAGGGNGAMVVEVPGICENHEGVENIRLILRSAKSHDAMVEALEKIRDRSSEPVPTDTFEDLVRDHVHILTIAEAVLALAKEGAE